MKYFRPASFLFIFFTCVLSTNAQQVVSPKAAFDTTEARALLAPGKSTIKGIAYYAPKSKLGIANINRSTWTTVTGQEVFCYPMTRHLEEWKKMRKKISYGKKIYKLSDECMKYYRSAFTDENGKFEITDLKPGKYWIWTSYLWTGNAMGDEEWLRLEKFVEVNADGEMVDVKITN